MAAIGRFRSDLSITRKTDGNFGNVSAGFLVFQSRVSTKTVVIISTVDLSRHLIMTSTIRKFIQLFNFVTFSNAFVIGHPLGVGGGANTTFFGNF